MQGCDREQSSCSGMGYDDIGLVGVGVAALAVLTIAKLVQR